MQVAAERQWGSRPTRFLNAYIAASNEIYLIDDAALYERHSRTIDEALAHELVHYFQAAYRNEGLAGDVPELEAVGVQGWFSTTFMTPHRLLAGASHGAVEH